MGIWEDIFGGSNTNQQSTTLPVDVTPGAFKDLQDPYASKLTELLNTGGPSYNGPLNAPITDAEKNVLGQLNATTGPGTDRNALIQNTINGNYLPGGPNGNPFLQSAIEAAQRPTKDALIDALGRTLPGRFTAAGQFVNPQGSSAFDRAAAVATRGAAQSLGDIASNISYQGYNDERNRQTQAVQLDQAEVDNTVKNLQAQALPRLIQELGIERGMQEFQTRTQALLSILQTIGGVTHPVIASESQSTGQSTSEKGLVPDLIPKGISGTGTLLS